MDELMLLTCMGLFTLLAGACSIVFNRVKLPPLIGYLVAGILIANFWNVGEDGHFVVDVLSDLGLVLLMFCIGLEVNLKKIRRQGVFAIKVAAIQLPLMILGGMLGGTLLGFDMIQCIVLGCIISGSSTAVVMAVLKSNGKLDKEHIDVLVLITIMEDIAQVIMLSILTPVLAGSSMGAQELVVMIVSIIVFMVASLVIGLKIMPRIVNTISDKVNKEVLMIFCVGLAFGMAFLSVKVGLSMAIGAFLMGMMIAGSRNSAEINEEIEPMKNLFMAMFFISVGMEIGLSTLVDNMGLILIFFGLFAVLKISTVFLGYWICNEDGKHGFISAVGLTAMGEFAFIIAKEAFDFNVVSDEFYTAVIGAALTSMIMLPILTRYSDVIWDKAGTKCPAVIRSQINKANTGRDELYSSLHNMSKLSQTSIRKSMTHAYMNVLLIIAIEIGFIYGFEPVGQWLSEAFGYDVWYWYILLLAVNFLVLTIPTSRLVSNLKYLDRFVIDSARRISKYGKKEESARIFQHFILINTTLVTIGIDFLIIMVTPNPLGLAEHFLILIIATSTLALAILKSRKELRSKAQKDEPADDDHHDEEYHPESLEEEH